MAGCISTHELDGEASPLGDAAMVGHANPLWLRQAARWGASWALDNSQAQVVSALLDGQACPVTLSQPGAGESYVANLLSAWPGYARHELVQRSQAWPWYGRMAAQRLGPALGLFPLAQWMKLAGLHRAALLDNWLISTNLRPTRPAAVYTQAAQDLAMRFPDRPVALRNVCEGLAPGLTQALANQGWVMLPARQVLLCDPALPDVQRRHNLKMDLRLLATFQMNRDGLVADRPTAADLPAMRACFRALFMDKHCPLNPDFSDALMRFCLTHAWLRLQVLRHAGLVVGVVGTLARAGWVTTPLLGYDLSQPKSMALYRRLMAMAFLDAQEQGCRLHLSSGADGFKRARGGVPWMEYTAVYARHLPVWRRQALRALGRGMRSVVPALLAHQPGQPD